MKVNKITFDRLTIGIEISVICNRSFDCNKHSPQAVTQFDSPLAQFHKEFNINSPMTQPQKVDLIPIFQDNYVFVIHNGAKAIVIDPGEAASVVQFLSEQGLELEGILITHHHPDHIGGLAILSERYQVPIYAPEKNREQIPWATHFLQDQDQLSMLGLKIEVIALPGHTLGHIAYWLPEENWLFSGDVIFGLSCGRLFEGTAEQAFLSFQKVKALPSPTTIFCTHEYTETNLRFCRSLNAADLKIPSSKITSELNDYAELLQSKRGRGLPSVPLKLETELKTNPFCLAQTVKEFAHLRSLRNQFR